MKSLVDRGNITIFLEIKFGEEDDSNFGSKLIHIELNGAEGRHLQFEVMCTGEVDGISYAKTVFLEVDTEDNSLYPGLCGGARNDGLDTQLPGFTIGKKDEHSMSPGLVHNFWDDFPTKFFISASEVRYSQVDTTLGNVVFGMEDVLIARSKAKEKGAGFLQIDDCGIVIS